MAAGFGCPELGYCRLMGAECGWRHLLNFGGTAGAGADANMQWHDIQGPGHELLDELAAKYSLHPLHVEDCRQDAQRTKLETSESYLFISLETSIERLEDQVVGAPRPERDASRCVSIAATCPTA